MQHFIARQIIHLQTRNSARAFELQQEMNQLFYAKVVPRLEELFDRLAGGAEHIRIEKLEVDLGRLSRRQLERGDFLPMLMEALEEQLHQLVEAPTKEVARMPVARSLFDRWLYFLEHGFLPWLTEQPKAGWREEVLATLGLEARAIARFRRLIHRSPLAFERLVKQHDPAFLIAMAELCTGKKQENIGEAMQVLTALTKNVPSVLDEKAEEKEKPFSPEARPEDIENSFSSEERPEESQIRRAQTNSSSILEPSEEARYVYNAGIVLLNPFLSNYFRKMGLLEGEEFKDEESRHRGIHLLHWLATGEAAVPEYEMVLPKLLCGLPLEIPLNREIPISEKAQQEGENLLLAAIEHWGALGDVSAASLQQGFLNRSGKLSLRQNGWYLEVEQQPIDLLLGKLPWNIGMVKLPWMPEVLRVEWG